MTGFGTAAVDEDGLSVRAEMRSVNHRYLQVKIRLPMEHQSLEPKLDALVKKKLSRGAITLTVNVARRAMAGRVQVDAGVAARYRELLGDLARALGESSPLSFDTLVQLPGVIGSEEDPRALEREAGAILSTVSDCVDALLEMRTAEGQSLQLDFDKNAAQIRRIVGRIHARMPKVVREHHRDLKKRAGDLLDERVALGDADLARELALIVDRTDVSEEIARLGSHIDQLEKLLKKGGAIGRKLDFLVQELMREANTIGSKCNDAKVAHDVVELKTHIERLREQAQNVE
jgi:uncharacterized protein (TIGR00255 family)